MSVWSVDQVLALAPDASAQKAARSLTTPRPWHDTGHDPETDGLWGRCQGSGADAYQVCVELSEPAYRCSCPSRKFPCKHALALLLRWAAVAGAVGAGYAHWEAMAARLVDAQAPAVAGAVGRLATVAGTPDRLLSELALLRLLVAGYRRIDELPADLAATVRARVGFPVSTEEVLAEPAVRDEWHVVGLRDEVEERLTTRRVWLRGGHSGRPALVLSFAAPGQALPVDLVLGTVVDADLCFYPGAQPLRALVARRHAGARVAPPAGEPVRVALDGYATALAGDPWLDRWPVLVDGTATLHNGRWYLVDPAGDGLPLAPGVAEPWTLVAVAGGDPTTVAAEWSAAGLRPLTAWIKDQVVRL